MTFPRTPTEERFWPKVDASGDCWEWTACVNDSGYGIFGIYKNGRMRNARAHRFLWELLVGPIPEGMDLDHLCRKRTCVNPDHLQPVSRQQNLLRGKSTRPAINKAKTHCVNGHPLSGENLSIEACATSVDGLMRRCRKCRLDRQRARAEARRASA